MAKDNSQDIAEKIYKLIDEYIHLVTNEFYDAWNQWKIDIAHPQKYEVIGALLSRIITLATETARAPSIWNIQTAPIILRVMVDAYINLAWIFMDPEERSKQYIEYGLGQAKLHLEQMKRVNQEGKVVYEEDYLDSIESWINSQRFTFLTEVNVGSWSGGDIRSMAEESSCKNIYDFAFTPFSNAVHNTWYQIGRTNIALCVNPLHGYHFNPVISDYSNDPEYFRLAAKYADKALNLFAERTGVELRKQSAYKFVLEEIMKLSEQMCEDDHEP